MRLEPPIADGASATQWLAAHLDGAIAADQAELIDALGALEPLAGVVLVELARHRDGRFSPWAQPTLEAYADALGRPDVGERERPSTSAVQRALAALQEASLVWRSHRGVYALEESRLVDLLRREGWLA